MQLAAVAAPRHIKKDVLLSMVPFLLGISFIHKTEKVGQRLQIRFLFDSLGIILP